jgi:hypothetical protein
MLNGVLILALAIGTVQGQADVVDNSPFAWVSVGTRVDGQSMDAEMYLGKESVFNIEGDVGARGEWKEFYCLFNGGITLQTIKFSFIGELEILRGENGEMQKSLLVNVVFVRGEEVKRVSTFTYVLNSSSN